MASVESPMVCEKASICEKSSMCEKINEKINEYIDTHKKNQIWANIKWFLSTALKIAILVIKIIALT